MNTPSDQAKLAAERLVELPSMNSVKFQKQTKIADAERFIQSAIDASQTEFIDRLITTLESHGIDATNWDGDDPPHIIIANGIATGLAIARADDKKVIDNRWRLKIADLEQEERRRNEIEKEWAKERDSLTDQLAQCRADKELLDLLEHDGTLLVRVFKDGRVLFTKPYGHGFSIRAALNAAKEEG